MTNAESATIAEIVASAKITAADPAANRCSAVIAAQTVPPVPLWSSKRADMIGPNSIKPDNKNQVKRKKTSKAGAQDSAPAFLSKKTAGGPSSGPPAAQNKSYDLSRINISDIVQSWALSFSRTCCPCFLPLSSSTVYQTATQRATEKQNPIASTPTSRS